MLVWACSWALSAQGAPPDASAKLKQFERNLENAMQLYRPGVVSLRTVPRGTPAPDRGCAIPLHQVVPDASFRSNMPVIVPDHKVTFFIRQVTPPAPSCDDREKK